MNANVELRREVVELRREVKKLRREVNGWRTLEAKRKRRNAIVAAKIAVINKRIAENDFKMKKKIANEYIEGGKPVPEFILESIKRYEEEHDIQFENLWKPAVIIA